MVMWSAGSIGTATSFDEDVAVLLPKYDKLTAVIEAFRAALRDNPKLTHVLIDNGGDDEKLPNVYAVRLDYPPLGKAGRGLFRVSYFMPANGPTPWQRITLVSIRERTP